MTWQWPAGPSGPGSGGPPLPTTLVNSFKTRTGNVVPVLNDYAASLVQNDSSVAGATVKAALNALLAAIPAVPVASVFGRVGAVVAALNDYAASLVQNDSSVVGATVKDALNALLAAIPAVPVASVFGRVGAVVATLNDYLASQVQNDSGVVGATVKAALDTLLARVNAFAGPILVVLGADVANSTTTLVDVTGLSFPVLAGKLYWYRFAVLCTTTSATTGVQIAVNGPTASLSPVNTNMPTGASSSAQRNAPGYDSPGGVTASPSTFTFLALMEGILAPTASGTLVVRVRSSLAGSAVTVKAQSAGQLLVLA